MKIDIFGTDVSLGTQETVQAWNHMQLGFLAHAAITPTHLAKVLNDAPNFALGHAVKGLFYLMLGRRELIQIAQDAFGAAQTGLKNTPATPRERQFVTALGLWLNGQPRAARDAIQSVLQATPTDALAMKIVQAISFILGDAVHMRTSVETVLPHYTADHAAFGYLLGCHAFTLEETGEYDRAEQTGLNAIQIAPDDAWGLHAVAHVYDMTANSAKGLAFLQTHDGSWDHCNNFGYHVWWHKALMHLDQGDIETVFALYDQNIRKDRTDDYRDISNATSLLSRLELEGHAVGNRWDELADLSANRTEDGCLIFADLHYILALSGGRHDAALAQIIGRIARDGQNPTTDIAKTMQSPGLHAAQGLEAFGEGNYAAAFANLAKARDTLQLAGGSHAQRDVFERITIDAGLRAGQFDQAHKILQTRQSRRGDTEDRYTATRYELIAAARSNSALEPTLAAE